MLQIYDRVLSSGSIPTLVALTGLILVLYIGLGCLEFVRTALFSRAGARLERVAGEPVFRAFRKRRLSGAISGDQELRDLSQVRRFVTSPALPAMFDAPFSPFYLLILYLLHWALALIAVLGGVALVAIAIINQMMTSSALTRSSRAAQSSGELARQVGRNAEIVEALGMGNDVTNRWRQKADEASLASMTATEQLGGFTAGTKALRLFLQSLMLGAGAYLAINGETSPGVIIAASILTGRMIAPLEQCVGQWRNIIASREAFERLDGLLKAMPEAKDPMSLPEVQGALSVQNLFVSPPNSQSMILKGISFDIAPGEVLGVIGPSAAGKTTLARTLTGVWPPTSGSVRLDGAELSQWNRNELGPQMGVLPQDVELLSGTVAENIARFSPNPDSQAIIQAAQTAGAHEMILQLEKGYDTQIGEGGGYLSAGQRQRVGLARALFGDPKFVLLDEPNSNLDQDGEQALLQAIASLKSNGATVIIIAHRPSAVRQADTLLVLKEGKVHMKGPRDEILQQVTRPEAVSQAKVEGAR